MNTRREVLKRGLGLAAIMAAGKAPAFVVRSMCAARGMSVFCGRKESLPYDAEVEYLEATGTQWINTGIAWPTGAVLYGKGDTYNGNSLCGYDSANCHTSGSRFTRNNMNKYASNIPAGKVEYEFIWGNSIIVDGVDQGSYSSAPTGGTTPIIIFARTEGGNDPCSGVCSYLRLVDENNTVLFDMIPVRFTNEQGEAEGAMYDKVSKKLFRNQGTGAFKFGRDINPISARSYVNDGLIAMWDGIENGGWGVHDSSTSTWVDLTGNEYDAVQRASSGWHWGDKAYVGELQSASGQGFTVPLGLSLAIQNNIGNHTIECVFKATALRRMVMFGQFNGSNGLNLEVESGGSFRAYYSGSPDASYQAFSDLHGHTASSRCNGTSFDMFVDGSLKLSRYQPNGSTINTSYSFIIGGENNRPAMSIYGDLYRVSVYSRALTNDEIAINHDVDKARFNLP